MYLFMFKCLYCISTRRLTYCHYMLRLFICIYFYLPFSAMICYEDSLLFTFIFFITDYIAHPPSRMLQKMSSQCVIGVPLNFPSMCSNIFCNIHIVQSASSSPLPTSRLSVPNIIGSSKKLSFRIPVRLREDKTNVRILSSWPGHEGYSVSTFYSIVTSQVRWQP